MARPGSEIPKPADDITPFFVASTGGPRCYGVFRDRGVLVQDGFGAYPDAVAFARTIRGPVTTPAMVPLPRSRSERVAGDYGLLVPFLRQSWALRNDASLTEVQRRAMRRDVRTCIHGLRHNRALPSGQIAMVPQQAQQQQANAGAVTYHRDRIFRAAAIADRRAAGRGIARNGLAGSQVPQPTALPRAKRARWHGASGNTYDTTIHDLRSPDLGAIKWGIALAVQRSADGGLTLIAAEPFVVGSTNFAAFCSWSGRNGATELHVYRLHDQAAQGQDAVVRDLLAGREAR